MLVFAFVSGTFSTFSSSFPIFHQVHHTERIIILKIEMLYTFLNPWYGGIKLDIECASMWFDHAQPIIMNVFIHVILSERQHFVDLAMLLICYVMNRTYLPTM